MTVLQKRIVLKTISCDECEIVYDSQENEEGLIGCETKMIHSIRMEKNYMVVEFTYMD